MAVQKSRVTRSRRGMRRGHDKLSAATLSTDGTTGEIHRRHHVSPEGYYKGRQVIVQAQEVEADDEEGSEG